MKIKVDEYRFVRFINRCLSLIDRQLAIGFWSIAIALSLSGCVKYETRVNFYSLNYGEIIEHIQLGEQLSRFSQNAVRAWVASIESRTKAAQGRIEWSNDRELKAIIPFHNIQELTTKINRYFNPDSTTTKGRSPFNSHLSIDQNNFLVAVRNHLIYDIDLRSLIVNSTDPQVAITSKNSVDLNFSLQSPWDVSNSRDSDNLIGSKNSSDRLMMWRLQPGKLNHIEAIFWLPNPLGIGAILIILLGLSGYYLKYRQLPWQSSAKQL